MTTAMGQLEFPRRHLKMGTLASQLKLTTVLQSVTFGTKCNEVVEFIVAELTSFGEMMHL